MAVTKHKIGSRWMADEQPEDKPGVPGLNPGVVVEVAAQTDDGVIITYYDRTAVTSPEGNDLVIGSVPRNLLVSHADWDAMMKKTTKPVHNKHSAADQEVTR